MQMNTYTGTFTCLEAELRVVLVLDIILTLYLRLLTNHRLAVAAPVWRGMAGDLVLAVSAHAINSRTHTYTHF